MIFCISCARNLRRYHNAVDLKGETMRRDRKWLSALLQAVCYITICLPATAQWLNYPDPRVPRTVDGNPTLELALQNRPTASLTFRESGAVRGELGNLRESKAI